MVLWIFPSDSEAAGARTTLDLRQVARSSRPDFGYTSRRSKSHGPVLEGRDLHVYQILRKLLGRPAPEHAERRRQVRVLCSKQQLRVSAGVRGAGARFAAELCDIGPHGLRLSGTQALKPSELVRVAEVCEHRSPDGSTEDGLLCTVQWCGRVRGGFELGLRVVDDFKRVRRSWMMRLLREMDFGTRDLAPSA